jgi:hypothetical protein
MAKHLPFLALQLHPNNPSPTGIALSEPMRRHPMVSGELRSLHRQARERSYGMQFSAPPCVTSFFEISRLRLKKLVPMSRKLYALQ